MQQPRMLTQDVVLLLYRISIATLHRIRDDSIIRSVHGLVKKKGASCNGWKTGGSFALQKRMKKDVKKCWQGGGGVVLYLSAKRWGKRMTSEASAGSPWKEPIDVKKGQFVLRNFLNVQVQKVQKLLKIGLDKKPLRWYNKQVVSRKAEALQDLENWTISKNL